MGRAPWTSKRFSLRSGLCAAVSVAGVVPVLLLGAYYASNLSTVLRRGFEREHRVIATASANRLQNLVEGRLEHLRILADEIEIGVGGDELSALLARYSSPGPETIELVVLDPKGDVLAVYPQASRQQTATGTLNYAKLRYFRAIADGARESVSGFLESKPPGDGGIAIAVAKRDAAGKLQAAVSCILERSQLNRALQGVVDTGKYLAIDVIDARGQWVGSSRTGELPAPIDALHAVPTDDPESRQNVRAGSQTFDAVVKPIAQELIPWHVVASRPSRLRKQGIRDAWFAAGLATLGVVILGVVAAWLLSRTIADPMRRIYVAIKTLERGDLAHPAVAAGSNDIGEIAELIDPLRGTIDRFNTSVSNIQTTTAAVGRLVKGLDNLNTDLRTTSAQTNHHAKIGADALRVLTEASERIHEALDGLSSDTETTTESVVMLESAATAIVNNIGSLGSALSTLIDGVQRMEGEVEELARGFQTNNRSVERVTLALAALDQGVQAIELAAEESSRLANNTTQDAENGRRTSQDTIRAMSNIAAGFSRLDQSISALASRSEEIDRIIEVIDNVTRATNLLAFNASIIAAQAGEHGAGFKVVAERVKSLADSTRQSTRDISELVIKVRDDIDNASKELHESARAIQDGEALSVDSERSLAVIMDSSQKAEAMVKRILAATQEQNHRLGELGNNVEELRSVNSALDRGTAEQRKALHYIESSVQNTHEINEKVSATAHAQASKIAQISSSARSIDGQAHEIGLATKEQQRATAALQNAIQSYSASSEVGASCSTNLEHVIRQLSEHLEKLDRDLGRFRT